MHVICWVFLPFFFFVSLELWKPDVSVLDSVYTIHSLQSTVYTYS